MQQAVAIAAWEEKRIERAVNLFRDPPFTSAFNVLDNKMKELCREGLKGNKQRDQYSVEDVKQILQSGCLFCKGCESFAF